MARYEIIDEPHARPWGEKVIINPLFILLAAILVPLIWSPPFFGRFWIPFIWLAVNGVALGSSTLLKEIATLIVGALACAGVFFGTVYLLHNELLPYTDEQVIPYMIITLYGVFFLTMYLVVFNQSRSYELYNYIRSGP